MLDLTPIEYIRPENILTIKFPDGAVGTGNFTYTLGQDVYTPRGYFYHLIGVTFTLLTGVTAGTRNPYIAFSSFGQNMYYRTRDELGIPASINMKYSAAFGIGFGAVLQGSFSSNATVASPEINRKMWGLPLLILTPPDDIVVDITGVTVTDQVINRAYRFLRSTRKVA